MLPATTAIQPANYVRPMTSIVLPTLEQFTMLERYASVAARAALTGQNKLTEAQALLIILKGFSIGIDPLESISQIYVVDNKPSMSAQMMVALANRSGVLSSLKIPDTEEVRAANMAKVIAIRKDRPDDQYIGTFTLDEARAANLVGKNNWKNYAPQMLINRAVSIVLRRACPEVLSGMYMVEELAPNVDVDPETGAPVGQGQVFYSIPDAPAQPPKPPVIEDAHYTEPQTVPPVWPSTATITAIYEHVKTQTVPDLSRSEFARLAGVTSIDTVDEWKKYPTGKDAAKAAIAKFNEEAQPKAHQWTAEEVAALDMHANDAYLLPRSEALKLVSKEAWTDFATPDAARTALKVAVIQQTLRVVARQARYLVSNNKGYTEFIDTPLPMRMYGSSEVFGKLGANFTALVDRLKAGETVELPEALSFEWKKADGYNLVKTETIRAEMPF